LNSGTCKAEELQLFQEISGALKSSCKRKRILEAIREAEENPDVLFIRDESPLKKTGSGKKKSGAQEGKRTKKIGIRLLLYKNLHFLQTRMLMRRMILRKRKNRRRKRSWRPIKHHRGRARPPKQWCRSALQKA
jgi:hypothetical protein